MPPLTRYADARDGQVAYQIVGPDQPVEGGIDVVYMTGTTSHLDVRWESPTATRFLDRLARLGRLVVFDRRGSGLSDPLPAGAVATWEEWMADLRLVLDAACSRQAALVATIDGGPTGMMFAAAHPERVLGLVLANTSARPLADTDFPAGISPDFAAEFADTVERAWGTEEFARLVAPKLSETESAWFAKLQRASLTPRAAAQWLRTELQADVRAVLPLIQTPTLILHSRGNVLMPPAHGEYLAAHIKDAKLTLVDSSDSALAFSASDEVADAIEAFLTGGSRAGEGDRLLATVVFTDIVGSTRRAAEVGDRAWRQLLERHDEVSAHTVERFGGRTWKSTGDGVMATFDAPGRAIRCLAELRQALNGIGIDVRAGVHAGEVEVRGHDISGLAVHIAARVLDAARDGGVVVSRTVADLVAGSGIGLTDLGTCVLRDVPGEWSLYRVTG